ncbi:histidine kinase N-terminal 7TM domain-containing protein [Halorubellus litoreus]|uniref:histidine kinase n=1 Tax=Halorubellus litoreus TaxID=755308 RepID=A0ABD5VJD0_9EURY
MSQGAQSMAFLMFLSTIPIIGVTVYVFRNRGQPGASGLLLCLVGMIGWSLLLMLITWPTRILPVHLNITVRFFFQLLVTFGWPLFVLEYLRRDRIRIPRWIVPIALVIPVITLALSVTNPMHHLVVDAATPTNPTGISEFVLNPWYYVHIAFASVLAMLPIGLLVADFRGAHGVHRQQLVFLMAGWVIGFPGALHTHLFRHIDAIPTYVDLTPMAFLVTALLWGLALEQHQLFSLVPVSRRTAVETLTDPVLTVGQSEQVVDANQAAAAFFGADTELVGNSTDALCRTYPALRPLLVDGDDPAELTVAAGGDTRQFVPQRQPITRGNRSVGTLYVFRDVTELRERETDLELLNEVFARVFRHNFRNSLNLIEGHATRIGNADCADAHATSVEHIKETSQQLLAHSEKATVLRNLINEDQPSERTDLSTLARGHASRVAAETPATVRTEIDDDVTAEGHPLVTNAIEELLENAIEHHTGPEPPQIAVGVRSTPDESVVYVEDDGPGIDESELDALDRRTETALRHGSGVGLWLVDLIVRQSGGSFTITDAVDVAGTRATVRFPRPDQ